MLIFRLLKGKRNYTGILFKTLTMIYLTFVIVCQLTTPTTAYFTDTKIYHNTLSNAAVFNEGNRDESSEESLEDKEKSTDKEDNETQDDIEIEEGKDYSKNEPNENQEDNAKEEFTDKVPGAEESDIPKPNADEESPNEEGIQTTL